MVGYSINDSETRNRLIDAYKKLSEEYTLEDLRFLYKYSQPNPSRAGIRSHYIRLGGDPKELVFAEGRKQGAPAVTFEFLAY